MSSLEQRAVACMKWAPGMLTESGWRVVAVDDAGPYAQGPDLQRLPLDREMPDLDDDATKGCLRGQVNRDGYCWVEVRLVGRELRYFVQGMHGQDCLKINGTLGFSSEVEVLIRVLEYRKAMAEARRA